MAKLTLPEAKTVSHDHSNMLICCRGNISFQLKTK